VQQQLWVPSSSSSSKISSSSSNSNSNSNSGRSTSLYLNHGDFISKAGGMRMADPDVPPEVDPTRRDPDEQPPNTPVRLPMVDFGGTKMDVNSRLLKDRIIMIGKAVDDNMANVVVAQLLYLANEDPDADITI